MGGKQTRRKLIRLAGTLAAGLAAANEPAMPPEVIFREDFEDLERWDAWHFEGIERASHYEIVEVDGATVLSATADRSASGLILRESFAKLRWAATPD